MSKLQLPRVTLLCADGLDAQRAFVVMERCRELVDFGACKLLTHHPIDCPYLTPIPPLNSHLQYSAFMILDAHQYVDTTHCLVVQHDGWVINPGTWEEGWLDYDYMGPLFIHHHVVDEYSVGTGGFSLRSKRLMRMASDLVRRHYPQLAHTAHEDGLIAQHLRSQLKAHGCKYAPPATAIRFAQGGNFDPANFYDRPFGFHGLWPNIDKEAGLVTPFEPR